MVVGDDGCMVYMKVEGIQFTERKWSSTTWEMISYNRTSYNYCGIRPTWMLYSGKRISFIKINLIQPLRIASTDDFAFIIQYQSVATECYNKLVVHDIWYIQEDSYQYLSPVNPNYALFMKSLEPIVMHFVERRPRCYSVKNHNLESLLNADQIFIFDGPSQRSNQLTLNNIQIFRKLSSVCSSGHQLIIIMKKKYSIQRLFVKVPITDCFPL